MIAFGVAVYAPDALVEAPDDSGQFLIEVDVGAPEQKVGGRPKVRFVGPVGPVERTSEKPLAETFDLGVSGEKSW